jgi:hypothetical protein
MAQRPYAGTPETEGPKTKTPPIRRGLRSKTVVSSRSLHATPPARHMTVMMAMDCVQEKH